MDSCKHNCTAQRTYLFSTLPTFFLKNGQKLYEILCKWFFSLSAFVLCAVCTMYKYMGSPVVSVVVGMFSKRTSINDSTETIIAP